MKSGSIVMCIHDFESDPLRWAIDVAPQLNKTYTVRELYHSKIGICVLLEEITAPYNMENGKECGFNIQCFRELEFPDDLETEITEALTRPERTRILVHELVDDNKFKKYTRWK